MYAKCWHCGQMRQFFLSLVGVYKCTVCKFLADPSER